MWLGPVMCGVRLQKHAIDPARSGTHLPTHNREEATEQKRHQHRQEREHEDRDAHGVVVTEARDGPPAVRLIEVMIEWPTPMQTRDEPCTIVYTHTVQSLSHLQWRRNGWRACARGRTGASIVFGDVVESHPARQVLNRFDKSAPVVLHQQ